MGVGAALGVSEAPDQAPILSPSLPTLLIFECVLAYMSPEASADLLKWFVQYSVSGRSVLGCVVYEMFNLQDSFGRVMVSNLKVRHVSCLAEEALMHKYQARNVTLPGVEPFVTLDQVSRRFTDVGFSASRALSLKEIRRAYIEQSELER